MNIRKIWPGRRIPRGRKVDPFSAPPPPKPTRANDRIVFHVDGWHYGACSNVKADCVIPRRTDEAVRRAVLDSPLRLANGDTLELVVDETIEIS